MIIPAKSGQIRPDVTSPEKIRRRGMNWEAIGSVAELLAAIPVVETAFYLAR